MGRKGKKKEKQKPTTTEEVQEKRDVFSSLCDEHNYAIEMFCVDCDKVICVICSNTEHKSGNHQILTIKKAATKCAETKEFAEYENNLSTISTQVHKTLKHNDFLTTLTELLKRKVESSIKKQKQYLIDLIETHNRELNERNQHKYENAKTGLLTLNEQLSIKEREILEICQEINEKKESGQNVALFIAMKKSQDNLEQIENQLEKIEKFNFVER
jgi:REP element-mobilizing transposase RayT